MNFKLKIDKEFGIRVVAWLLGAVVVLQSPILTLVPRFYESQIKVRPDGTIPPGLWVLGAATILAAGLTVWDKAWAKKREDAAKKRRSQQEGFFQDYTESLARTIEAVQQSERLTVDELRAVQRAVLTFACKMVRSYLGNVNGLNINANVMRREAVREWVKDGVLQDVRFLDKDLAQRAFDAVLHLTVWAEPPGDAEPFALPVARAEDKRLLGAPRALAQDAMQIVADTRSPAVEQDLAGLSPDVRNEVLLYLKSKEPAFVSFVSKPLRFGDTLEGVLNVQSNQADILGPNEIYRHELEQCLLPFCAILGILIARERECEAKSQTEPAERPNSGIDRNV